MSEQKISQVHGFATINLLNDVQADPPRTANDSAGRILNVLLNPLPTFPVREIRINLGYSFLVVGGRSNFILRSNLADGNVIGICNTVQLVDHLGNYLHADGFHNNSNYIYIFKTPKVIQGDIEVTIENLINPANQLAAGANNNIILHVEFIGY